MLLEGETGAEDVVWSGGSLIVCASYIRGLEVLLGGVLLIVMPLVLIGGWLGEDGGGKRRGKLSVGVGERGCGWEIQEGGYG